MAREPITKLAPSRLDSQLELLDKDIDLEALVLFGSGGSIRLDQATTDGYVNRTMEGASTLELTVLDRDKKLLGSGMLGAGIDTQLDGLFFRLIQVRKIQDSITLIFESREVAILRTYNKKKTAAWGKTTRTRFAASLVAEVKELRIPFICPEMSKAPKKKVEKEKNEVDRVEERGLGVGYAKDPGIGDRANINRERFTIKGVSATKDQLNNVDTVLDVGVSMGARRKVLVTAIMTIIQESSARNVRFGDRDSLGLFQQRPSQGWGTAQQILNPAFAAASFFERAIVNDEEEPNMTYSALAQSVQISAFPDAYGKWRTEAERMVTQYGLPGGDISSPAAVAAANNQIAWQPANNDSTEFQFTRGRAKIVQGNKRGWSTENSWDCLVRLAEEVQWRCFEVSGSVYFISETKLFQSAPRARISEKSDGINWIDFDYAVGKKNAKVTVSCRIDRWAAPPGTTVELTESGPANGRWLVSEIRRPLFNTEATITLKKPQAKLPEPKREDVTGLWDTPWNDGPDENAPKLGPPVVGARPADPRGLLAAPVANREVRDPYGHTTDGLPGYPAVDIMATGGAWVLAPEAGKIVRLSGRDPALHNPVIHGSSMGYSIYFEGISGTKYYMTHMGETMSEGSEVAAGTVIGLIAEWPNDPGRSHLHFAIQEGSPFSLDDFARLKPVSAPGSP